MPRRNTVAPLPFTLKRGFIMGVNKRPREIARPLEINSPEHTRNGKREGITVSIHSLKAREPALTQSLGNNIK